MMPLALTQTQVDQVMRTAGPVLPELRDEFCGWLRKLFPAVSSATVTFTGRARLLPRW
jgi:hypothetical protein